MSKFERTNKSQIKYETKRLTYLNKHQNFYGFYGFKEEEAAVKLMKLLFIIISSYVNK